MREEELRKIVIALFRYKIRNKGIILSLRLVDEIRLISEEAKIPKEDIMEAYEILIMEFLDDMKSELVERKQNNGSILEA